jgi:hypothetical protein
LISIFEPRLAILLRNLNVLGTIKFFPAKHDGLQHGRGGVIHAVQSGWRGEGLIKYEWVEGRGYLPSYIYLLDPIYLSLVLCLVACICRNVLQVLVAQLSVLLHLQFFRILLARFQLVLKFSIHEYVSVRGRA